MCSEFQWQIRPRRRCHLAPLVFPVFDCSRRRALTRALDAPGFERNDLPLLLQFSPECRSCDARPMRRRLALGRFKRRLSGPVLRCRMPGHVRLKDFTETLDDRPFSILNVARRAGGVAKFVEPFSGLRICFPKLTTAAASLGKLHLILRHFELASQHGPGQYQPPFLRHSSSLRRRRKGLVSSWLLQKMPAKAGTMAEEWWLGIRQAVLRRQLEVAENRMKLPELSTGDVVNLQKQILDLREQLHELSKLSPAPVRDI